MISTTNAILKSMCVWEYGIEKKQWRSTETAKNCWERIKRI